MTVDIEKLMKIDLSYPGISFGYESFALDEFIKVLNDHLKLVQDQYRLRAERELENESSNMIPEEYNDRQWKIDEVVENVIPRYFRISTLIPIWGIFESFVIDIANYVKKRENTTCSLRDIQKQKYFWKTAVKYFEGVVGISLPWTDEEKARLGHLQELRQLIAHRNGRLMDLPQGRIKEIENMVKQIDGVKTDRTQLFISDEYIHNAKELVFGCLTKLNQLVSDKYDGPIVP